MALSRAIVSRVLFVIIPMTLTSMVRPLTILAQAPATIVIRGVTAPLATSKMIGAVDELREIADGNVLVNDGNSRALMLFDPTLEHATMLADTLGTSNAYPRFGKLIPYTADSSLFYESDSRSLVVIDPQGKLGARACTAASAGLQLDDEWRLCWH